MPTEPEPNLDALRLIESAITGRLEAQRSSIERLETKGAIILGFVVAAAQFVIVSKQIDDLWKGCSLAAFVVAFAYGVIVVRPYKLAFPPDPVILYGRYRDRSSAEVLRALSAARAQAFKDNQGIARTKRRAWWTMLTALLLGICLSGVGVV